MNNITRLLVCLMVALIVTTLQAQDAKIDSTKVSSNQLRIETLTNLKITIENEEREFLKSEIEAINKRLDNGEITASEAEELKKEAAKIRALNIENRLAIIDNKIALLERNSENYNFGDGDNFSFKISLGGGDEDTEESIFYLGKDSEDKPKKYDRRTYGENVTAIGFNNTLIDGQNLSDSPYKLGGSGYLEWGYTFNTRIFKNTNFWRVKYGLSLQWNKLNIKDNQYFVNTDGDISLQEFPIDIDKAKFRATNLVFPVHLEFGPSKKIVKENYFRYSKRSQLKIGVGGYAGVNLWNMQKIKYKEDGHSVKNKQNGGYEVSPFIYGLSGYVGIGEFALFVKYDLNPLFSNQAIDQNNISFGIRFDTL